MLMRSESLKKNNDFRYVYSHGRSVADQKLVMYVLERETAINRIGVSVSKKVGNSIVRHRIKRLIRECYRLNEESFQVGKDIVVVARKGAVNKSYDEIRSSLMSLAARQRILQKADEKSTDSRN